MTAYTTMYHSKVNSPATTLSAARVIGAGTISLNDVSVLPDATSEAPCLCVVGAGDEATTYRYTGKTGTTEGTITGVTVQEGVDATWPEDTVAARNFTSADHESFLDNLEIHNGLHDLTAAGDPHPEYILHEWDSDAENDFLVGTGSDAFTKKTLNETKEILFGTLTPKRSVVFRVGDGGAGIYPRKTTNPCADPSDAELSTNKQTLWSLAFADGATDLHAQFLWWPPDNWDAGTVTAKVFWTATGGTEDNNVTWAIMGTSVVNEATLDKAFGSPASVTDVYKGSGKAHITGDTGALTIADAAAGMPVYFDIYRDVSEDNLAVSALLLAVKIEYGISAYSE